MCFVAGSRVMARVAWNPETHYEHGPLVPFIALGLVWLALPRLRALRAEPADIGLLPLVLGILLFVLSARTLQPRIALAGLPPILLGVVLYVFGRKIARVLLFPITGMLVIGGAFGTAPNPAFGGTNPSQWYVASYFTVVIAATGLIMLPVHLATYRERGVLRRFAAAGFPRWSFTLAQLVVGVTSVAVSGAVLLAVALPVYGVPAVHEPGRVAAALALGAIAFVAIGVLLGSVLPSARAAQAVAAARAQVLDRVARLVLHHPRGRAVRVEPGAPRVGVDQPAEAAVADERVEPRDHRRYRARDADQQ